MAILEVLRFPDERLRKVAAPVDVVDDDVRTIVDNMFETMYQQQGVGLAATQVDIHRRIVVMDTSEDKQQQITLINPEIIRKQGETISEEGCLSVPDNYAKVTRAEEVTVRAQDRNGDWFELDAEGLLAVCIQHELDHLVGKLFVDYLSPLKRQRIRKKLEKEQRLHAKQAL